VLGNGWGGRYARVMTAATDPLELARRLIACPSVTPADAGALDVVASALEAIGFTVHSFVAGKAPDGPVRNLYASRGTGSPHFAFAGHTDVVPPGDGWSTNPFQPEIRGELLHGRGAVDMKGAIAAFIAAALTVLPGFAPQVEASTPQPLAKGDRLEVRPVGRDCSEQAWPNFETSCLRAAGSKTTIRQARLVTADRMP